jgi:co-chaperonin GroES (HSP10)
MKQTGRVLAGKILLKQDELKKTKGGIILESTTEKPKSGIVVVVGDDRPGSPMEVGVGDRVRFEPHAGTPMKLTEEDNMNLTGDFLLIDQSNVLLYNRKEEE